MNKQNIVLPSFYLGPYHRPVANNLMLSPSCHSGLDGGQNNPSLAQLQQTLQTLT